MRSTLYIILLFVASSTFAQKIKTNNSDSVAFALAMKIGDYAAAIDIQYQIVAKDPKNVDKIFQLAELYYDTEQFKLCENTCFLAIEQNPKHHRSWQMLAVCYQRENNSTAALIAYNNLDSLFPSNYYKYQKASLLFEKKSDQAALNQLQIIINDSTSRTKLITVTYQDQQNKTQQQNIPLQAAAYNMAAFIMMSHNENDKAKILLDNALAIAPNFQLAIGNKSKLTN